jgi:hypothetical protein
MAVSSLFLLGRASNARHLRANHLRAAHMNVELISNALRKRADERNGGIGNLLGVGP